MRPQAVMRRWVFFCGVTWMALFLPLGSIAQTAPPTMASSAPGVTQALRAEIYGNELAVRATGPTGRTTCSA